MLTSRVAQGVSGNPAGLVRGRHRRFRLRDLSLQGASQFGWRCQCYVRLSFADLGGCAWRLQDQMAEISYDRDGSDLQSRGLYLEMAPWQASVFTMTNKS